MSIGSIRHKIHLVTLFTVVILLLGLLYIGRVAEIVIVAALLAYILDPVVTRLERYGVSRAAATTLIMFGIMLLLVVVSCTLVPLAFEQIQSMKHEESLTTVQGVVSLERFLQKFAALFGLHQISLEELLEQLKGGLVKKLPDFLMKDSVSILVGLIMVPFMMFFMLKDVRSFKKYFISLVPNRYFEFTLDLIYKMEQQLGNYLRGQFLDAVVFGVLATATLWALDVPYFLIIGIFAGFANLIPFVGPIVGAFTASIAVIFYQGELVRAIYVLVAFIVLKLIDDLLIQPLAVGKHVNLHPMVIALAILAGGHLFGILGMLLVIPFLGFFKVVLEEGIATYRKYSFD
jgi:predicted PurR-regulated permease PerM